MKQLPIIQSLWIGNSLSTMERLCISSFLYHGHSFHLYTYNHIENVPKGTVIKDANKIVPSDMIFKYKDHASYAGFSNLFRYKLLFDKGGYWVDTDVVCLKPLTDKAEYVFASERLEHLSNTDKILITCCIIKAPNGSNIMEYCYNVSVKKESDKLKWGDTGPQLIDEAVKRFDMESYVAPPEEFCPVDWWNWRQFTDGSIDESILENSRSVHLWNEMWRRNDVDKDTRFKESSIYEWLKNTYLKEPNLPKSNLDTDNELVSICVMSYNLEKYIAEALDSILMQKVNFNYNIVVGDDCSTDNTRQILQEYVKKYPDKITLLLHSINIGIVANFAATLKSCHGKYIALLDGDDYWTDPLKLQKQVDFLESNKDYSMVFHNIELHTQTQNGIVVKPFNLEKNSREYTYDEITRTWSVGTCSVLCVNNKQYQYIENNLWFPVQDLPFYLGCSSKGKIYYISDTMSVYRRLLSGSMNSKKFRDIKIHFSFIKYYETLYNDFRHLVSEETINRQCASHYLLAAQKSKKNENDYIKYLSLAMSKDFEFIYKKEIKTTQKKLKDKISQQHQTIENRENTIQGKVYLIKKLQSQLEENISLLSLYKNYIKFSILKNPMRKLKAYSKIKKYNITEKVNNDKK